MQPSRYDETTTLQQIEKETSQAAAAIREYLKTTAGHHPALIDGIGTLTAALAWFQMECRSRSATIGEMDSRLRGVEGLATRAAEQLRDAAAARAAIQNEVMKTLKQLVPKAKTQAKAGKPALLRMILRATK